MSHNLILWVDDDIRALSGLKAYIHEIEGVVLRTARTFDAAQEEIDGGEAFSLIIFDMVLMEDGEHAALDRRMGIHVARRALEKGVKLFVAYTVLSREEVLEAWSVMMSNRDLEKNDVKFEHFPKGLAAVKEIQKYVREILER